MRRRENESGDEEDGVEAAGGDDMRKGRGWIALGRPADEGAAIVSPMEDVCTRAPPIFRAAAGYPVAPPDPEIECTEIEYIK
jgi:hypothetical protein